MAAEPSETKVYRIWADGCFDLTHWGHLRVFKQAKEKRQNVYTLVGIHSDADITAAKGPPLINEDDRYFCARACRWVDEVVEAAPYITYLETLEEYNCDFCVHGSDITLDANGNDCYALVKKANKYEEIERTDGISTSEVINRMLAIAMPTFEYERKILSLHQLPTYTDLELNLPEDNNARFPTNQDRIVFIDGSFDLLHSGTLKALQKAKALGSYLIVGIHEDDIVHTAHGDGFPILSLYERVFSVLGCRWVDACIPNTPWVIGTDFKEQFGIDVIATGKSSGSSVHVDKCYPYSELRDIVVEINSESTQTVRGLCDLVAQNSKQFIQRNIKKGEIQEDEITIQNS